MTTDRRMLGQLDVIQILRRYAIDHLIECDERAKGFYEAIHEAERYFQLDDSTPPVEMKGEK